MVNLPENGQTTLPTIYDLPSEEVGESGLPNLFHFPYYGVYDRRNTYFQAFHHQGGRYQELDIPDNRLWLEE